MAWRVAKALLKLRTQIDAQYPNRSKKADGAIGDAAHASRSSDHNPWIKDGGHGIVSAIDITHDLKSGLDTWSLGEHLRLKKDRRIKYVISNKRIFSSTTSPWTWRRYTGSNPHSQHIHVSVKATKNHYDDDSEWNLPGGGTPTETEPEAESDSPADRVLLRRGSRSEAVRTVQRLLSLEADGIYGADTEAAVKGFQRASGLKADGMVGTLTWAELDFLENIPTDRDWQRNIVATVFGGKKDRNKSAYEDRWITDDEIGVALPHRFRGDRPQIDIVNAENGKRVTADIVDVGPWNTTDEYWAKQARPQAESGRDSRNRRTNSAGIDLTPGAAREIGLSGKGVVHWAFAEDDDEGESESGEPGSPPPIESEN